jgi:predicted amidohydrolase
VGAAVASLSTREAGITTMKIACLQFAPQVGDIDNNLNRADAVLNKASAEDLADLDLLVLPELAFSGMRSHLHLQESTVVILDD